MAQGVVQQAVLNCKIKPIPMATEVSQTRREVSGGGGHDPGLGPCESRRGKGKMEVESGQGTKFPGIKAPGGARAPGRRGMNVA